MTLGQSEHIPVGKPTYDALFPKFSMHCLTAALLFENKLKTKYF